MAGRTSSIVVHDDQILDGRNRFRAGKQIGIEPVLHPWDSQGSPEAFVISMNLHRRHLNKSRRAMIGGRLVTLENGQRADRMKAKNQAVGIPTAAVSLADAGEAVNVFRDTISQAKAVLAGATPEEIEAIQEGQTAVNTVAEKIRKKAAAREAQSQA